MMTVPPLPMETVLQGTAAVDQYVQAQQWSPDLLQHTGDRCCHALHSLFLSDLGALSWQCQSYGHDGDGSASSSSSNAMLWVPPPRQRRPRQQPLQTQCGAGMQLEQFLQDDLQRFMELQQEELEQHACTSDAAALASGPANRRLSNCSSSNSGISFVRLPEHDMHDAALEADSEEHHPVALAAAAAMAAAGGAGASPLGAAAAVCQQAQRAAAAAAAAASCEAPPVPAALTQPHVAGDDSGSSSSQHERAQAAAAAAAAPFVMQPEEELAAQKRAARARLTELERTCSTQHAVDKPAGSSDKAWAADAGGAAAGSMHGRQVPQRPGAFAAAPPAKPKPGHVSGQLVLRQLASKLQAFSVGGSEGLLPQHRQFLQHLVAGLALCMLLMPVLWLLQAEGGSSSSSLSSSLSGLVPVVLLTKARQVGNALCIGGAASILLYLLTQALLLQTPLLHFREPALEQQYFAWSSAGRLLQDCLFQLTFMAVGSCMWLRLLPLSGSAGDAAHGATAGLASTGQLLLFAAALAGSAVHVGLVLFAHGARQVQWREWLLGGNRLLSVLALVLTQLSLQAPEGPLQLSMPLIALAQVMSIACMQVRLSSFVLAQLLQLLVLLPVCARAASPWLHTAQLFGGWLCLPCLVLFCMELQSRKAFLTAVAPVVQPQGRAASGKAVL